MLISEFGESEHHKEAASHYCEGRMPKLKNLRKELSEPFLFQFHHADMSGVLEEKFPVNHQELNEYKFALGWSIEDIKRQT